MSIEGFDKVWGLRLGQRVMLKESFEIENGIVVARPGDTGTVVRMTSDQIFIFMDDDTEELREWDNCIIPHTDMLDGNGITPVDYISDAFRIVGS